MFWREGSPLRRLGGRPGPNRTPKQPCLAPPSRLLFFACSHNYPAAVPLSRLVGYPGLFEVVETKAAVGAAIPPVAVVVTEFSSTAPVVANLGAGGDEDAGLARGLRQRCCGETGGDMILAVVYILPLAKARHNTGDVGGGRRGGGSSLLDAPLRDLTY